MLGADKWKQAVCLSALLAPAAMMLVMTPETGSNCEYFFSKSWFWGEHTDSSHDSMII